MSPFNLFQRISKAPTNPRSEPAPRTFDVAELYDDGPVRAAATDPAAVPLDEKLRQAYFWIVNNAIISPHYDIEYHDGPSASFSVGDSRRKLTLPSAQSYSSYVLLPLLTFAARRKCLFIGGPGRGKTASAILMGVLAGYPVREVRRAMQHGHPQMTIADLLGNPLPADLVAAQDMKDIRIAWRQWLSMRVKIIDEYNRIPTRTQSALLTVMGDNYAEILDHVYECPESAWYLTANDDRGGGTYQVIEALRDRIDVIVQALAFNPRFLDEMLLRIEENIRPEEVVPRDIVFSEAEGDRLVEEIRAVEVPHDVRRRIEFFSSQFELMETAGAQFEYLTKDTVRLAGADWAMATAADSGRDRMKDLGCQTRNGLSVRNLMTILVYAKALAYFRGNPAVALDDVRHVLPFVLNDKLQPDLDAPFFALPENAAYRSDRLSWLRQLFDAACGEYDRLDLDRDDPVGALSAQFAQGLDGVDESEARARLARIERTIEERVKGRKLYGHLYDDLLKLKYLHQRYTNYLHWLRGRAEMVSAALAGVLASRRMEFNRRVAEARHRTPGLDTGAFSAFVGEAVNAVCTAVDALDPAATPAAVDAAFDIGLDLVAQGLAGPAARRPWVDRAWLRLAPATARLLARAPLPTLAAITNAVVRLGAVPGVRVDAWIAAMAAQAGRCERLEALRDLGALCAWRAGMAHLRQPALAAAARLDPALAAATCRVADAAWPAALQRLQRERWWDPGSDRSDPQGHTVGGFTGFGGPFATPPDVRAGDDGFVVAAGDRHHVVIADAFGAVVLPGAAQDYAAAASAAVAPAFVQLGAHGVSVHGRTIVFAVPGERLRAVAGSDSVALFSPWSHTIRVVPATP